MAGVGLFMERPREDAAVGRSALLVVLLETTDAETVDRLAELVALPVNPCGEISAQIAPRSPRLRPVGKGYVDAEVVLIAGPAKLRRYGNLVDMALAGTNVGETAGNERRAVV